MADEIRVQYASLDNGSAMMRTTASALQQIGLDHHAAAQKTYPLWDANTAQMHNWHMTQYHKDAAVVHALINQQGVFTSNHRELTQYTDASLAGRFELA